MNEQYLSTFLEDMTYQTSYTFLENGKDDDELKSIAEKRGIITPSHDLAIFKGKYAFVDRFNRNGCRLPKEDVEKAIGTLVGKSIDFDHFRKRVVGHWIDGKVDGDTIIAYGCFFKSNFQEDFGTIKELLNSGKLAISFEAWGNKIPVKGAGGKYDLTEICFAGGALLIKETPAFPGAGVLEMAQQRVLEFAKVMTKPDSFLHTGEHDQTKAWDFPIDDKTLEECQKKIGTDFSVYDAGELKRGIEVEKEHGTKHGHDTNVTNDEPVAACKIAMAHLKELPDYYTRLEQMEDEGKKDKAVGKKMIIKKNKESQTYRPSLTDDWRKGCFEEALDMTHLMGDIDCAICHTKGNYNILNLDFASNSSSLKCSKCGATMVVSFTKSDKGTILKEIKAQTEVAMFEDILNYIEQYQGSDEDLEMFISKELEGELEEAKFIKCGHCAAIFDLHGNTMSCPKCGAKWEKDKPHFQEIRPEERTDSPYSVVNANPPVPASASVYVMIAGLKEKDVKPQKQFKSAPKTQTDIMKETSKKLNYKERQNIDDSKFAVVVNTKNKKTGAPRKIRMFPIHDPAHVRNALARLPQAAETLKKLGISQDTVRNKILKRARELKMDELLKRHNASTVEEMIKAIANEVANTLVAGSKVELGSEAVADVKKKIEQALVEQDTKQQTDLSPKISEFLMPHVTPLINYNKPEKTAQKPSIFELDDEQKPPKALPPSLNEDETYRKEYQQLLEDLEDVPANTASVKKICGQFEKVYKYIQSQLTKATADLATLTTLKADYEKATADLKKYKDAEAAAAKTKTDELVKARKEELGDFAKDMKDEDMLDETKYEMAKLRKENAELKKGKAPAAKPDLSKGAADKEPKAGEVKSRTKIDELAFGRDTAAVKEQIKKIGT